jgi:hypothetical protein
MVSEGLWFDTLRIHKKVKWLTESKTVSPFHLIQYLKYFLCG